METEQEGTPGLGCSGPKLRGSPSPRPPPWGVQMAQRHRVLPGQGTGVASVGHAPFWLVSDCFWDVVGAFA